MQSTDVFEAQHSKDSDKIYYYCLKKKGLDYFFKMDDLLGEAVAT